MTTSGSYSFTVNRDQVIRMSMLILGKLDESETPSAQEVTDLSLLLNMLVKQWQGKADFAPGLKTFTRRRGHLFLSNTAYRYTVGPGATGWTETYVSTTSAVTAAAAAGTIQLNSVSSLSVNDHIGIELDSGALFWSTVQGINTGTKVATLNTNLPSQASAGSYVFSYTTTAQQPIVIETAFLRDVYNSDTPLNIIRTVQDYDFLPNKTDPTNLSDPTAIYYEQLKTNSYLYTDVGGAQDVTKHICITFLQAVEDLNSAADEFSYPQEWYLALSYGLAEIAAPIFTVPWTQNMATNAAKSLAIAQKKEPEVSTMYFQSGE